MTQEPTNKTTNLGKLIVKGSISFSTSGLIQQLILLAQGIITYRVLTVPERGTYGQVWSIFALAGAFTFIEMFKQIVIQKVSVIDKSKINHTLTGFVIYSTIASICFVAFFFAVFQIERSGIIQIFKEGLSFPLLLTSVSIFFSIDFTILFVGIKHYSKYNLIQIISTVVHFVLCVSFLLIFKYFTDFPPYYGIFLGMTLKTVVMLTISVVFIRRNHGRFFVKLNQLQGFGELLRESFGLGINFIVYAVFFHGSIIVLSLYASDTIVGQFGAIRDAGINISRIISILLGYLLLSIIPKYLKKYEYEIVEKMTGYVSKAVLYILSIIMLALIILPEAYILVFNSDQYLGIQALYFNSCFLILTSVLFVAVTPLLITQKKIPAYIGINAIRTIVFLSLSFIILPIISDKLIGILLVMGITYTVNIITTIFIAQKSSKVYFFKYYQKLFIIIVVFISLSSLLMFSLRDNITFFWKIPIYLGVLIVFHVCIITFGAVTKQDLVIVEGIVLSFFKEDSSDKLYKLKQKVKSLILWVFKCLKLIPLKDSEIFITEEAQIEKNVCVIDQSNGEREHWIVKKMVNLGYCVTIITPQKRGGTYHSKSKEAVELFFVSSKDFSNECSDTFDTINSYKRFKYVISIDFAAKGIIQNSRFKSDFYIVLGNYWRKNLREAIQSSKISKKFHGVYLFLYHLLRRVTYQNILIRAQKIVGENESICQLISKDIRSEREKIIQKQDLIIPNLME